MTHQRVGLSGHDDHPVRFLRIGDPERVTLPFTMHLGPIRTRRAELRDPISAAVSSPGQPIDVTARIKCRQAVQGLISEYWRAA
jgi:hypothetical protein